MRVAIAIIYIILCGIMVALILSQEGKQQGLGAIAGSNVETYWSKARGRSREGMIKKATVVLAVLFVAGSLLIDMFLA